MLYVNISVFDCCATQALPTLPTEHARLSSRFLPQARRIVGSGDENAVILVPSDTRLECR